MRSVLRVAAFSILLTAALGCETYDAPPHPSIEGLKDGLLSDPKAPIVVSFAEPIRRDTLGLDIIYLELDIEGNLPDVDGNPKTQLHKIFEHRPGSPDVGGTSTFVEGGSAMSIQVDAPMPVGPSLAVLVDSGLSDLKGNRTMTRKQLAFGYEIQVKCNKPTTIIPSGYYFFLANVEKPIATQVQLLARVNVDAATGEFVGQFSNADRNTTQQCPTPCASTEVCRLLPAPACVAPSEKAGTEDEYPDYVPNPTPPIGYTFRGTGCAIDQADGSAVFAVSPVDVVVQSPPVTLKSTRLTASFALDDSGVLRGTGSFKADDVLIGTFASGPGLGGLVARLIPDGQEPKGIPGPTGGP